MRFGILGPLLVDDGEGPVSVPAGRLRLLLAALLLHAGQTVRAEALANVLWDGSPPAGAADTLRTHVMRLRRVLGPSAGARLVTRYPGYLLEAGEDEVDLLRFARLCRDGGAAVRAGMWPEAAQTLTEALALWRGPVLADVRSQLLQRDEVPRLEQLRLQAREWRIDADLHLGRHADLVPELQSLAAELPLRERFHAQLMLALYRCGRQAEALAAYQRAREALVEELGTEPGSELRALHQQILTSDPALEVSPPAAPRSAAHAQVPRQLPGQVPQFVGRDAELATLTELLEHAGRRSPATVVISAIGGTAGVGKTALAVHWAHQIASRFPDGQLHVNLRGYDSDQPVAAADALAGFLRALGVPGQDIPAEIEERAARYRSLLADKRMLIMLDNASGVTQVRPLLPGDPGCAVIVTSRNTLAGLVARDGAARLELDLLPPADAVGLLRELIGSRAVAEPDSATELARLCCRLPLALRVAAELAAARPKARLADLVAELGDRQRRLDLLDAGGDPRSAVRTVFSWTYQHLDPAAARAFRLAGLHPGPDLEPYALAALTGTAVSEAAQSLTVLARAHLVEPVGSGRHGMHDLLRAYARELAASTEGEHGQRAALTDLFDYYLFATAVAVDILYPAERHRRPRIAPSAGAVPSITDSAAARSWLDGELPNLVAVAVQAADHGWPGHATRLAVTLFRYLDGSARYSEALVVHSHARAAAREAGDRAAEAEALACLGQLSWRQGPFQQAADYHREALTAFREVGDLTGQARALGSLGNVCHEQGSYDQAADFYREALALFREAGDRVGEAYALNNLGVGDEFQGRYQQGADYLRQALTTFRAAGDRTGEAMVLDNLGSVLEKLGRHDEGAEHHRQALTAFREIGDRTGEGWALNNLGVVDRRQGRYEQAASHHRQALAAFREVGDLAREAETRNRLGQALLLGGLAAQAEGEHAGALKIAVEIGHKYEQARALDGLGHVFQTGGDSRRASEHWQQALVLYADLGVPEADKVRARLAATGEHALAEP